MSIPPSSTPRHERLVGAAVDFVQKTLAGDSTGHDWWHVRRVWQLARRLAGEEGADLHVVDLAALLHDAADWKFHGGDEHAGPRVAREWLERHAVAPAMIDHVCEIIARMSFKGAGVPTPMPTVEGRCVQDADRLDALGAIGVARAFAFGGHRGQPLYDPDIPSTLHDSFEAYKRKSGSTVNHFYEKLLLLKDRMQTAAGRRMAESRHAVLAGFLERFLAEWNLED